MNPNKRSLADYNKLKDPRLQQVLSNTSTMQLRRIEDSNSRLLDSEDPYRSFKRDLLQQQAVDKASRESKRSRSKGRH